MIASFFRIIILISNKDNLKKYSKKLLNNYIISNILIIPKNPSKTSTFKTQLQL